jgi:Leucine-rich repeat (LRR) protein
VCVRVRAQFAQLHHLTRLELRGCGLVTLPSAVAALPSLKSLNVEGNVLTGLPKQLMCESQLEVANISCNRLPFLPPCLYAMSNLRQLVVSSGPVAGTTDFHTLHLQLPRLSLLQVCETAYGCVLIVATALTQNTRCLV